MCDPGSTRSDQALLLQRLSNVAESGLWVFRVDGPFVVSGGTYVHVHNNIYYFAILPAMYSVCGNISQFYCLSPIKFQGIVCANGEL